MKKQIDTSIKAHLLRSALYVILLLAVCVIPFALGQRSIGGRKAIKPAFRTHAWIGHSPLAPASSAPAGTCTDPIVNGDFETGDFTGWVLDGHVNDPVVGSVEVHTGTFSALAGLDPQDGDYCAETSQEPLGDSSFYQEFTVPAGGGTLSFWYWTCTFDSITFDWQDAYITDTSGTILQTILHQCNDDEFWQQATVDMGPYAGQTVRIKFLVHQDGFNPPGDVTGMFVDDVTMCGAAPTPTPTASPTATPSVSPTCPPIITESTSTDIEQGDSIACNDGIETLENHYWRAFNMNEFTGGIAYNVTSVDIGIELAQSGNGQGQPLTVNLYANHGLPFPGGDWQSNLIGTSGSINIPDEQLVFPVNIPITATVAAGTLELVMEVMTPDGTANTDLIFIGANSQAETGLSYVSAPACSINDPTPTGDLGFPNTHWVFNVNGNCGGTPTPTPTVTPTPTATPSATPTVTPTVTPTPTATPAGCVFSQGYWKNHPEAWPVTELQLGNTTYTQDQLLAILHQPPRGNGILILAHQEIAAKLNIANGADGSCIAQTLADADALIGDLVVPPIGDGYLRPQDASPLADVLDQYNEGGLCAPSCEDEGSPPPGPSPRQRPLPHSRPVRP
jgi:hypothetical protein